VETREKILNYVKERWEQTIRRAPEDKDTLIGLPHPYIVPCMKKNLQELYYWDTYFACKGLVGQGFAHVARSCADNFIYLVNRYGFVPNGNRTYYLNRSQPPYLCSLVKLVFEAEGDKNWLLTAHSALEKEYSFWMTKRITPIGLNSYGHHATEEELLRFQDCLKKRIGSKAANREEQLRQSAHMLAEAESGWDFTPRFNNQCLNYAPADLNAILYQFETNMADFSRILGRDDAAVWTARAERRQSLMNQYCWNENRQLFQSWDFVAQAHAKFLSAESFSPLWAGVASPEQAQACLPGLAALEFDFGIATCEKTEIHGIRQWAYPNGWPPLQCIAFEGWQRYGFVQEARRIAQKYVEVVVRCFEQTGDLWEKYNVVDGNVKVSDEYPMPVMMGWSAGVFVEACALLAD
jgi:alpha,alpha-trehalase